jgi:hypothetical protein
VTSNAFIQPEMTKDPVRSSQPSLDIVAFFVNIVDCIGRQPLASFTDAPWKRLTGKSRWRKKSYILSSGLGELIRRLSRSIGSPIRCWFGGLVGSVL